MYRDGDLGMEAQEVGSKRFRNLLYWFYCWRSGSDICGAATEFSIVESGQPAYKAEERGCLRSSFLEERLAGTVKASHARPFRVTIRGNGQLCRSVNEACTSALSRHSRGNTPRKFFMVSSRPDFTHALCAARARFCSKPNCFISGCLSSSRVCAKIVQFVSESLGRNLNGEISNWIMNKGKITKWMVENYFFKLSVIWCYCISSKKSCKKKKHFSTIENLRYINL